MQRVYHIFHRLPSISIILWFEYTTLCVRLTHNVCAFMMESTTGRFSALLSSRMEKLGHTRKSLATVIRRSVEHVRKLESGEALPGPDLQQRLAEVLELDQSILKDATENDRWLKKYGRYPSMVGRKSATLPIERAWVRLSRSQKEDILCIAECMSRRNRKRTQIQGAASRRARASD